MKFDPIFEIWYKKDSEFEISLEMTVNLKFDLKISKIRNLITKGLRFEID